ncbi:MAG: hypothetical protein Q9201_003331 [Fulgogasparrea decipioides]
MTTARAASTVVRAAKSWQDCSVHVKIFPRPQNLAESKQVLHVLQQYGEVVTFRHLKYESPNPTLNAALAIYRDQTSAHNAIYASPIRFQLQQGSDGWTSRISQDASLQGLHKGTSGSSEIQGKDNLRETTKQPPSSDGNEELRYGEVMETDLQSQQSYPHDGSPDLDATATVGPNDKWGSRFPEEVMKRKADHHRMAYDTNAGTFSPSCETRETLANKSSKKRNRKSTQKLAEELAANSQATSPPEEENRDPTPSAPVKEFELTVAQSLLNHQAYIERQGYYAGFNPDMKTIMAADLKDRVPLEGLADCRLNKGEVPLRQRLLKKERARPKPTLMELWESGKRERGEI